MAWKLAPSFILVSELHETDCVYAVGVSHKDRFGSLSVIRRRGAATLSTDRIRILNEWFGTAGKFPAVKIATGEIGA